MSKGDMSRNVGGMFGGGDVGDKGLREIVSGRGEGSIGGESGGDYMREVKDKLEG
ncbi:hypothetical protein [Staphylococcus capitis]|uniref:hypothetical protein n=1 Tax=Staphylococcus capitis TaxID=29388 RepID=UPI00164241DD|nr:hypothetical protein [Staphylococcus capitis]